MTDAALNQMNTTARGATAWGRLKTHRDWLGFWFILPAAAFLILFLAYPLGLGIWISFTDARIGRTGEFIGLENYEWLWDDSVFWLSVFNTLLYTTVASIVKFAVGLYLALLLNENLPFKAMLRAVVLIPFIVPTVLSAIAFWWLYDSQFSLISWSLRKTGLIATNIDFLGDVWNARWSVIFASIWRGSFVASRCWRDCRRCRPPSTRPRSTAPIAGRCSAHHLSHADPDHRRRDDLLVLFTFTHFSSSGC
jgi:multiple sugar transport system permease protein